MKKCFAALAAALLCGGLLAGCSWADSVPAQQETAPVQQPVDLRISFYYKEETRLNAWLAALDGFAGQGAEFRVTPFDGVEQGWAEWSTAALPSGIAGDVVQLDGSWAVRCADWLVDLNQYSELLGLDPLKIEEKGVTLSFVPEDRLGMGLVGNMDLADNMMLRSFRKGKTAFTDRKTPYNLADQVVKELEVVTPGISTPVRRLSGGNVQKVLVGREISLAPKVLLTAYAVRGLDINSSYVIYDLVNKQKQKGVAVVFVGEDLDVLLELADRILVLCDGKVSGIVPGRGADKRTVGMMMTRLGGEQTHE